MVRREGEVEAAGSARGCPVELFTTVCDWLCRRHDQRLIDQASLDRMVGLLGEVNRLFEDLPKAPERRKRIRKC